MYWIFDRIQHDGSLRIVACVVMTLLKQYLNEGHSLFVDNWYTSLSLFKMLRNCKTGACGTIRKKRTGSPYLRKFVNGEHDYRNTDNLLAMKCRDKRDVIMLPMIHKPRMIKTGKTD